MNWECIQDGWKRLKSSAKRRWARRAQEKQIAEWLAHQHKVDPIHS